MSTRWFWALLVGLWASNATAADAFREAAARALVPIEQASMQYPDHRDCFSCHHQALPVFALTLAKEQGFDVEAGAIRAQVEFTRTSLSRNTKEYREGKGQGGAADTASYGLFTLDVGKAPADAATEAVAGYLLKRDADRPDWKPSGQRPPSEGSPFSVTYLALRALKTYGGKLDQKAVKARFDAARKWLIQANPADTEDRVYRLLALQQVDAGPGAIEGASADLLARQRVDGGWGQTDDLASDAYATGSALVALHLAGGLDPASKPYRKGLTFLVKTQKPDGTWHVASRSKPFQRYFESGFPHGKDQFISISASCWAAAALVLGASR